MTRPADPVVVTTPVTETIAASDKGRRDHDRSLNMSISSVGSANPSYASSASSSITQRFKDLQNLDQALQSGNLSDAQSAFATFQQNLTTSGLNQGPFSSGSAASKDVQSIQSALQAGDLSGAQKAFGQLKTDLRSTHPGKVGGHHRHPQVAVKNDNDADDGSASATSSSPSNSTTSADPAAMVKQLMNIIGGVINHQA